MPGYHVTIYIDSELLREIEEERGDVPRSRFIVKLIRLGLQAMREEEDRRRSPGYRYVRRVDRLL
jgi:metal-responsive CopG/Arc/MetJ family transcriptional regulator